jgi:hypothetical protein
VRFGRSFPFKPIWKRVLTGAAVVSAPVPGSSIYIAELTVYDDDLATTRVLYYSSGVGMTTRPTEAPASTYFDPRIKQASGLKRDLFDSRTTQGRSRTGFGDLLLLNDDGELDGLIDHGFDGRQIIVRQGERGAAYPSEFITVLIGTMEQAEFSSDLVRVKIRDRQFETEVPLQPTKYDGDNVLPAGLEGVEDLKGKPKPVCYGKVVNVPAVCVNTSKLIYQIADAEVSAIDMVYDRGIPLSVGFPPVAMGLTPMGDSKE